METSYYLDKRKMRADGTYSIRIVIRHNNQSAAISSGYSCLLKDYIGDKPSRSGKFEIVKPSAPYADDINLYVETMLSKANVAKVELTASGMLNEMSVTDIRDYILGKRKKQKKHTFDSVYMEYTDTQVGNKKTLGTYTFAKNKLAEYLGDKYERTYFQDIDVAFCMRFDGYMRKSGIGNSSRSIVFRSIRTIFNYAITCKYVSADCYPFGNRGFKTPKSDKGLRVATADELRALYNADLPKDEMKCVARDIFFIMLFGCGINPIDLYNLKKNNTEMVFTREKTRSKNPNETHLYITDALRVYVDRYAGERNMFSFSDRIKTYESFYAKIRQEFKRLTTKLGFPDLTLYSARYTWASFASSNNCKVDLLTIDMAMGHIPQGVSSKYYIMFDWENVADAQRKVDAYIQSILA